MFSTYAYSPYGEDFAAEQLNDKPLLDRFDLGSKLGGVATIQPNDRPQRRVVNKGAIGSPEVTYSAAEESDWQPYKFGGKESLARVGLDLYDFGARMYSPSNMRWMTMDPLAEKYYHISPYAYCAGNPVNLVDPEGKDSYVFDENGQYLWKNEEKGEHRIAYRSYSTDAQGKTNVSVRFYEFADPINDPQSIDSGAISQLRFLSESDIRRVLREQGADNGSIIGFAINSIGGGDFDYAFSYFLSKKAFSAKVENGEVTSPYLFVPIGTDYAHNLMNLGSFLWAITGYINGFNETILKKGANINSIYLSPYNGYPSQPDSDDDQLSISEGVHYAHKHHFRLGL